VTRIVVLVSGSGTNLQALLDDEELGPEVVLVVSDRPEAGALLRAEAAGVPTVTHVLTDFPDRPTWEAALTEDVAAAAPDLVVLAGFMRILSAAFVGRFRTVNIHPSLLPAFPGAHAVRDALEWGVKITGCTVHLIDEQVDHGPILAQQAIAVEDGDDEATLHARIKGVEHLLLPEAVRALAAGRVAVAGRRVRITT
jgi:phosphoribosylglycinamide formyltransferase 1